MHNSFCFLLGLGLRFRFQGTDYATSFLVGSLPPRSTSRKSLKVNTPLFFL